MKLAGMQAEDYVDATGPLPVGEWTHVAATVSAEEIRLYVGGVLVGSNPAPAMSPLALGATAHNYLGRSQNVKHPYFPGAVDDFRLFGRVLSAQEVAALAAG